MKTFTAEHAFTLVKLRREIPEVEAKVKAAFANEDFGPEELINTLHQILADHGEQECKSR